MKSMKISKKEQKELNVAVPSSPDYPYGLVLRLGKDELKKLGISSLPKVGDAFVVDAKCVVKSVSASSGDGGDYASCELQITDMGMEDDGDAKSQDTAKKMFTKMGGKY